MYYSNTEQMGQIAPMNDLVLTVPSPFFVGWVERSQTASCREAKPNKYVGSHP